MSAMGRKRTRANSYSITSSAWANIKLGPPICRPFDFVPERSSSLSSLCSFFKNGVRCCLFECLVVLPMVLARLLGAQAASIEIT
jgi:hypothetical protein